MRGWACIGPQKSSSCRLGIQTRKIPREFHPFGELLDDRANVRVRSNWEQLTSSNSSPPIPWLADIHVGYEDFADGEGTLPGGRGAQLGFHIGNPTTPGS